MTTRFDERLGELHGQMLRLEKVNAMLRDLYTQQGDLSQRESQLRAVRQKEQSDVDRLERGSLAAFFYAAVGKKEARLEQERREALAAAVKHDNVLRQLQAVRRDIASLESERDKLYHAAQEYRLILEEKQEYLKIQDPVTGPRICALEEALGANANQQREIQEAITAGQAVLRQSESILGELNSAEGWGTWDLLGGGLLTDLAKHSHLDDAQNGIDYLQVLLNRFHTELTDVQLAVGNIQAKPGDFLTFADYFFDGLLADWAVMNHIHEAQAQINNVGEQTQYVLNQLNQMQEDCAHQHLILRDELDTLVKQA